MFVSGQDVADIAEWEDEQIEYIKEKITEEGRKEDLKKGKAPEQVSQGLCIYDCVQRITKKQRDFLLNPDSFLSVYYAGGIG